MPTELEALIAAVGTGARYRAISPMLVEAVARAELPKRRSQKEAVKAVRSKLHQVVGVFLESTFDASLALGDLRACTGDEAARRRCCRTLMEGHTSMRERLPLLETFYERIFRHLGAIHSVLDLGCGLNPLAIPWMPLAAGCAYHAFDVHGDLVNFLTAALPLLGVAGSAHLADLTHDVIEQPADLALLLKCLPSLEQLDRAAGARLLRSLQVKHMVVSFPVRSLGGRQKGMLAGYEAHFRQLVSDHPWQVERLEFPTELVFVITTDAPAGSAAPFLPPQQVW